MLGLLEKSWCATMSQAVDLKVVETVSVLELASVSARPGEQKLLIMRCDDAAQALNTSVKASRLCGREAI